VVPDVNPAFVYAPCLPGLRCDLLAASDERRVCALNAVAGRGYGMTTYLMRLRTAMRVGCGGTGLVAARWY
jgi:hypothetical protein